MTTLHMQTEIVRNTALGMKQTSEAMSAEMQALRASIQRLVTAWDSSASDQFQSEAESLLRQLMQQQENLSILADRVTREVQEWEDVDNRGSSSMQGIGSQFLLQPGSPMPFVGGSGNVPFYNSAILPLFAALSVMPFISNLPGWLDSFIDKFFPPPKIVSPVAEIPFPETTESAMPAATPEATDSAKPAVPESPASKYDTYYDIPAKSQGLLYGSAACLPTSMSMVLDHYHNGNSDLKTATPDELVKMLDPGDGSSTGIGLDKLNDDLAELGYQSTVQTGSMEDLSSKLKEGPVIVNAGVKLVSQPARDITQAGSVNHSMLVKAINADSVVVNDPWSGAEKTIPRQTFEKMWSNGQNYMVIVRPQEK